MEIRTYETDMAVRLKDRLLSEGLTYGATDSYTSLISPSSTVISTAEQKEVQIDLDLLWDLYRKSNWLYVASMDNEAPSWIARMAESGLNPIEKNMQRLVARKGLEPKMCRVDYISFGEGRKIAEVQWKSGGPGLFFGMQEAYKDVVPFTGDETAFGDPINGFFKMMSAKGDAAVNDIRGNWTNGEVYLRAKYLRMGLNYNLVNRLEFAKEVKGDGGRFKVGGEPVNFFYFYWSPNNDLAHEAELYRKLAYASLDGLIWVENPMNYAYRAKWQFALPFMDEFKGLFSDRLRQILSPTVIIRNEIDLEPIIPYMDKEDDIKAKLSKVKEIDDILKLGEASRKALIVKCAGSKGEYYNRGKGVFRLTGGKGVLKETVDMIKAQMSKEEPWIVQEFVCKKYDVPIFADGKVETTPMHARFMVFGQKMDAECQVLGGLANFAHHWKVSGKKPGIDANGNMVGSTFTDIRVKR